MRVWPQLSDGAARVAVYAGAGAIDYSDGDLWPQLIHPLQHRPLSPAVGNSHILKSCFPTVTTQKKN